MKNINFYILAILSSLIISCHEPFPDFDGEFPSDMEVIFTPNIEAFEGYVGDTLTVMVRIDHEILSRRLTEINEIYMINEKTSFVRTVFEEELKGLPSPIEFKLSHVFKKEDLGKKLEYGFEHKSRTINKDGNGHLLRVGPRVLKVITKERP